MQKKLARALVGLVLALSAGGVGYTTGTGNATSGAAASAGAPIAAPSPDSVRVLYSLDEKHNDQELISLIEGAKDHVYFAIYTFTLPSIADALVAAKKRGVDVRGLMDSEQSSNSYGNSIKEKLLSAGIPLLTENHENGTGIMHIKLLVTEGAYAFGSYNWTKSATMNNDEILEIGTNQELREAYENILLRLFKKYGSNAAASAAASVSSGTYDFTNAKTHIGEYASVRGKVLNAYTSKSGTVFFDYCTNYKTCPFSAVIFADGVKNFGDISKYSGQTLTLVGKIVSYEGRAEIVLSDPNQISK